MSLSLSQRRPEGCAAWERRLSAEGYINRIAKTLKSNAKLKAAPQASQFVFACSFISLTLAFGECSLEPPNWPI